MYCKTQVFCIYFILEIAGSILYGTKEVLDFAGAYTKMGMVTIMAASGGLRVVGVALQDEEGAMRQRCGGPSASPMLLGQSTPLRATLSLKRHTIQLWDRHVVPTIYIRIYHS